MSILENILKEAKWIGEGVKGIWFSRAVEEAFEENEIKIEK